MRYHATDLRYFISSVKGMTHRANIVLVYIGHALTVASVTAVIAVTFKGLVDNKIYPDYPDDVSAVMRPIVQSSLVFGVLNIQCISAFTAPRLYAFVAEMNMDELKEEIDISGVPGKSNSDITNLYGILINVADVLNVISDAYTKESVLGDTHVKHLGTNEEALRRAFKLLFECKARVDGDAEIFQTSSKA
jgi:hypothetical protein